MDCNHTVPLVSYHPCEEVAGLFEEGQVEKTLELWSPTLQSLVGQEWGQEEGQEVPAEQELEWWGFQVLGPMGPLGRSCSQEME